MINTNELACVAKEIIRMMAESVRGFVNRGENEKKRLTSLDTSWFLREIVFRSLLYKDYE